MPRLRALCRLSGHRVSRRAADCCCTAGDTSAMMGRRLLVQLGAPVSWVSAPSLRATSQGALPIVTARCPPARGGNAGQCWRAVPHGALPWRDALAKRNVSRRAASSRPPRLNTRGRLLLLRWAHSCDEGKTGELLAVFDSAAAVTPGLVDKPKWPSCMQVCNCLLFSTQA